MLQKTLAIVTFIFLTGAIVLLMLINLSFEGTAISRDFYFSTFYLGTDFYWKMYSLCYTRPSGPYECTPSYPATPYVPSVLEFENMPPSLIRNKSLYFHASRAGFAFLLASLVFACVSLIPVISMMVKKRLRGGVFAQVVTSLLLLTTITAAVLETSVHAAGCHAFRLNGIPAHLGVPMFICMWFSVICAIFVLAGVVIFLQNSRKVIQNFSEREYKDSREGSL